MASPRDIDALGSLSTEDLHFDIQVQTTILLSLEDALPSDNTATEVQQAKQRIKSLRRILKTREAQEKAGNPSTSKQNMNPRDSYGAAAGSSGSGSGSGPSAYSTPTSADNSGSSSSAFIQKKRPYAYLDDDDSASSRNKSLRTTPSPSQRQTGVDPPLDSFFDNSFNDNNFICDEDLVDLTGDDDDVEMVMQKQRDYFNRLEQSKEDEKFAKSLMDHGTPPNFQEPAHAHPAATGPSAFDRILSRPPQTVGPTPPTTSVSSQGNDYNNFTMPGSFPNDITATNYDFMGSNNFPYVPAGTNTGNDTLADLEAPFFPSNLSQPQFGQPSFPQYSTYTGIPAAELARRAAFNRQDAYGSYSGGAAPSAFPTFPGVSGSLGFGSTSALLGSSSLPSISAFDTTPQSHGSMANRPGMLNSGLFSMPDFGSLPNGLPLPSGSGLSNIIDQTSNFDWTRNVDAFGQPINERLRDYYEHLQDDPRKTEEEIKELLANIRPDEEIPVEDRVGTPEALRYPLYPHQQLALKWMTTCEEKKNKGGILADDMGLGKTISTLALMVSRQSPDRNKTTLIVAPVALVRQWEIEISKKVNGAHKLSVFMQHGKHATFDTMRGYDVVLTTFGKLSFEEKRYAKWIEDHPGADPAADVDLARVCPLLHPKSKFYRVILDEAQCIKNTNTYSAKGACRLNATHRWCLTGTPMMNGIHELYSLIKFLRIGPYNQHKEFTKMFGCFSKTKSQKARSVSDEHRKRAMDALRALLRAIMLRRMKTSKLDGKPLLDLPPKVEEVTHVVFDEDERSFYKSLETGARHQFNKYLRAGTVGKHYSNVLVLLLRLRQACCHPHLNLDVEYVGNTELSAETMETLAKTLLPDVIGRLKCANADGFVCPICLDPVIDPTIVLPCGHNTCSECFSTLVAGAADRNLRNGNEGGNSALKCPECRGSIEPTNVINFTTFKAVHMPELVVEEDGDEADSALEGESAAEEDSDDSDSNADTDDEEAEDVDENGNLRDFVVKDDEDEEEVPNVKNENGDDPIIAESGTAPIKKDKKGKSKRQRKGKGKGKGKAKTEEVKPHMLKALRTEAKKNKVEYKRYMKYLKKNWLPSAKVTECCRLLQSIQESGEKTIVFSQFTFLLDLLEIPVKYELGIKYCRYDGSMSRVQRDAAALDFQDPNSPTKVMLVSLKAGNAGLNLVSANHVIIMDPFWNPYVEMQAVDRAHRIGQQKQVYVHRLLVEETVEDRIVSLQEAKRQFVDAALDEGESKALGRLSVQDLTYLFNGTRG